MAIEIVDCPITNGGSFHSFFRKHVAYFWLISFVCVCLLVAPGEVARSHSWAAVLMHVLALFAAKSEDRSMKIV